MDVKSPVAEARNEYTYSAGGAKLKVVQKWNPSYLTAPVIGSAINTSSLTMNKTTDYVGNIIYENNSLKRILVDGGYIENGIYYYYLTDHLGNNRIVVNASGTVIQKNHYYPFGMSFAENSVSEQGLQPYKYNNKELDQMHGVNMYDYSARHLALDIPRFTTVDPLAEKYYSISPYAYVGNNPLKFIDPTGMDYWKVISYLLFLKLLC
ncbi:MAG: RHS repeat-associated core domain-containing protein [Prevotella sp.]|nr:RHS repeat-associated core domain-containing protein [Prevotella sp.]